ncbi:MAG: 3-oxoadipate enol-lactonase [Candidatus Rokubacteria bacterium]|nr:3-oxoadipate enol-lactonase [Candidatus Rokubacteria bacterium]
MKQSANGIEINYEIEGSGPVVTFSHSLGCNLSMWDEQVRALAGRYRVLRYDTRGHGKSSAPGGLYTLAQLAEDLHGLLAGLGIRETHFVGLSMGGMIGQTFALAHPAMIQSLVLCDTTSRYPAAAAPIWKDRIETATAKGMEPLVEGTLERWFTPAFRARRPEVMDRVRAMIRSTPAAGYIGCCHAIPKIDVTDRLGAVRVPALVIVGEEDPGTPVEMARAIHAALPAAELAIIRSASHLSNLEQPEEFNRLLGAFLDKAAGKKAL